ncbi:phosphate ABC transporter permease [Planctomyces sp. SCGC AG-212-M04]|nr:phosphate ABC transporter permease [Planctomyces sp. SCGC AG-212-M04]
MAPQVAPARQIASVPVRSLERRWTGRRISEWGIQTLLFLCAFASILTTAGILYMLASETIYSANAADPAFFQQVSLRQFFGDSAWRPNFEPQQYGIWPLLSGTFLITFIAGLVGLPIGILSAIYLSEYARPKTRSWVKPSLELLAGVPTVVYGYFGLMFVTPYVIAPIFSRLGFDVEGRNALAGGIVVGLMLIPMVCSLSEDALRAVPRSLREAGYALGSTKFDVSVRVVVPAAFSGIVASFLLALSRAVGETMAVAIAAGIRPSLTLNPLESTQTMTSFIVNMTMGDVQAGSMTYKSLFAVATCLFVVTLVMNVVSQWVMRRYRESYQ